MSFRCFALVALLVTACGPAAKNNGGDDAGGGTCNPGDTGSCYDGQDGTAGVGPCHAGTRTCTAQGLWTDCMDEVIPVAEVCGDGVDNNCNGMVDEDVDMDGDGWTTCQGDCCDSTECSNPKEVNPGAFEVPGDGVDNDCDGHVDNALPLCDMGLASNDTNPMDYAKAIDLCQTTTTADPLRKWGVISATMSYTNGMGTAAAKGHAIRPKYGTHVIPHQGAALMVLSTGAAAGEGDTNPAYEDLEMGAGNPGSSPYPADFIAANGGKLPNAPGCLGPLDNTAYSPQMLTLKIRVPTNAHSFTLDTNFFSSEFPEYTCSPYNDFYVILLDSTYSGTPANPADKNLAFYEAMGTNMKYPVGVNLANGNTGLFTQCKNGTTGCLSLTAGGSITTCTGIADLAGTGLDTPEPGNCDANALEGGGTGWLKTSGNVTPGEVMTLRIALWNVSDDMLQSLAVIDNFTWSVDSSMPGTVIFRNAP